MQIEDPQLLRFRLEKLGHYVPTRKSSSVVSAASSGGGGGIRELPKIARSIGSSGGPAANGGGGKSDAVALHSGAGGDGASSARSVASGDSQQSGSNRLPSSEEEMTSCVLWIPWLTPRLMCGHRSTFFAAMCRRIAVYLCVLRVPRYSSQHPQHGTYAFPAICVGYWHRGRAIWHSSRRHGLRRIDAAQERDAI